MRVASLVPLTIPLLLLATPHAQAQQEQAPEAQQGPAAQQEPEAQQEQVLSQVDLVDGGAIYGAATRSGDQVLVVRGADTLYLPASQVERIRPVRGHLVDGRFMRADPNETRLFFGPTARTMPAGDAYLGVFELYLPFVAYGVTDRITIAGGAPLLFFEGMPMILYVAPKIQFVQWERATAAVGALSFFTDEGNSGVVYGVATFESPDGMSSTSAGLGGAYADGEIADGAVIMLGGDLRVSRSVKLISENYVITGFDDSIGLFALGFRFLGERLSADIGLVVPSVEPIALPLVNFVYSF